MGLFIFGNKQGAGETFVHVIIEKSGPNNGLDDGRDSCIYDYSLIRAGAARTNIPGQRICSAVTTRTCKTRIHFVTGGLAYHLRKSRSIFSLSLFRRHKLPQAVFFGA